MSFVKIPDELLDADITAAQFRILANLIKYSFDDGHSYIGYTKLAEACYTSKSAIIKALAKLQEKGFIQISHRGKFSRSNDIVLTFDNGLKKCRKSGEKISDTARKGCLNDTPQGCLNDTPQGCLNDTYGCLNDTPHKDIRFKYQDLNLNTRETGSLLNTPRANSNYIAPDDVASGRSMPDGEQVAESSARKDEVESAQTELEDFCIISAFFEVFPAIKPWVNISKVGGYIAIHPIGPLGEKYFGEIKERAAGWFALRNIKLVLVPANQKLKGQLLKGGAA